MRAAAAEDFARAGVPGLSRQTRTARGRIFLRPVPLAVLKPVSRWMTRPLRPVPARRTGLRCRVFVRILRRRAAHADSSVQVRPDPDSGRTAGQDCWRELCRASKRSTSSFPCRCIGASAGSADSIQSELLAREIGRRTHTPVENAVRRVRNTPAQAGLTSAKRRLNVSGAFRAKKRAAIDGRRVLLIDDVMTTGATAASCARALKRAGARQVTLLTLARADRRPISDVLLNDSNFSGRSEDA